MKSTANRILVVEDDVDVAQSIREGLGRDGYGIVSVGTVKSALSLVQSEKPHLVLLDVRLPDGSGFEVCRSIRERGMRMPIIFLSVQAEEIDRVVGLEVGADDFIAKPYRLRELQARVHAQLRRAYGSFAANTSDMLYAGDLVIDRSRATVVRDGVEIRLTPTEFRILVHLARHPSQVFSKAQLFEAVWGYEAGVGDEDTVKVHLRRLREKIEPLPQAPSLIVTVRGLGYKLRVA